MRRLLQRKKTPDPNAGCVREWNLKTMSRLFACSVSEADLLGHVIFPWRALLQVPETESPFGWGIGYHQQQNVLIKRRPNHIGALDFYDSIREIRASTLLGHVRKHTVGRASPENTHPFRFRQWMFAHHGTIERFESIRSWLINSIPSFLKRSMRGDTDSEHLFHLYMAFLYDDGLLDESTLGPERAAQALKNTFQMVDRFVRDAGGRTGGLNVAVTNGQILLFTSSDLPTYYVKVEGIYDCELCRQLPDNWDEEPRRKDHPHVRGVLVFNHPPEADLTGLKRVPMGSILTISKDHVTSVIPYDTTD